MCLIKGAFVGEKNFEDIHIYYTANQIGESGWGGGGGRMEPGNNDTST
jgi:hypothetical protein